MAALWETIRRGINGIRKVAAGLRPFSESVWPGVRNDLFVAHESIYAFCARFASGQRVLDAGCGTGHGSFLLAQAGAASVIGIDIDPRNVRFARRRYALANLSCRTGDIEELPFPDASFDLVVASNALEHLHDPGRFFTRLRAVLAPNGRAIVAVPPIYSAADAETHANIHYHRSNLSVSDWARLLRESGFSATGVLHEAPGVVPNFQTHFPSTLTTSDFVFTPVSVEELCARPSITAIFDVWTDSNRAR